MPHFSVSSDARDRSRPALYFDVTSGVAPDTELPDTGYKRPQGTAPGSILESWNMFFWNQRSSIDESFQAIIPKPPIQTTCKMSKVTWNFEVFRWYSNRAKSAYRCCPLTGWKELIVRAQSKKNFGANMVKLAINIETTDGLRQRHQ